jgi:hypothetical protein
MGKRWDYYERYPMALIMLEQCGILKPGELELQMTMKRTSGSTCFSSSQTFDDGEHFQPSSVTTSFTIFI